MTSIAPSSVPDTGGTRVTITGTDLNDSVVTVAGTVVSVDVNTDGTQLTFVAPAKGAGNATVLVAARGLGAETTLTYTSTNQGSGGSGSTPPPSSNSVPETTSTPDPFDTNPVPVSSFPQPGSAEVSLAGSPAKVTVTEVSPDVPAQDPRSLVPNGVSVSGPGFQVTALGPAVSGPTPATGLFAPANTSVAVQASGFAAGTPVRAYLLVEGQQPVLLGERPANTLGVADVNVMLPSQTLSGPAVIQVNGTSGALQRMNVNIGMFVAAEVSPQPQTNQELPVTGTGKVTVLDSQGRAVPTSRTKVSNSSVTVSVRGSEASIRTVDTQGTRSAKTKAKGLVANKDGYIRVTGSGFSPGTAVSVWGFSTPVLIGVVYVDANGSYNASLPVPEVLTAGRHTLQSVGTTSAGSSLAVSTGLTLTKAVPNTKVKTKKSRTVVTFGPLSSTLDAADRKKLRKLVKAAGKKNITSTRVLGYVQRSADSSNDVSLSRARAVSVAEYLRKLGVNGKIVTEAKGVSQKPGARGRSARVTVTFVQAR